MSLEYRPPDIPFDVRTFMEALRRTSNLYDLFVQYAGTGPALEQMWVFYDRMPERGSGYSRCQAWREYGALEAEAAGDAAAGREIRAWPDDLVILLVEEEKRRRA